MATEFANPPRLGFAGSPEFAATTLRALIDNGFTPLAVWTQPDRPAGRGRKLRMSPVKTLAATHRIPVLQPLTLKNSQAAAELAEWRLDLLIVVAYGLLLPENILATPRHGCWNIHASLLPRWRGAAPIQRAIQAGDDKTGVCIMQMDAGLDTGPILRRRETPIAANETGGSLHERLAHLGAATLIETLQACVAGNCPTPVTQSKEGTCYAGKLSKAEAEIDWRQAAVVIERSIRAFNPWPVSWCRLNGERTRIFAASLNHHQGYPGEILKMDEQGIEVACGEDSLTITRLQRPGGGVLDARDYANAMRKRL